MTELSKKRDSPFFTTLDIKNVQTLNLDEHRLISLEHIDVKELGGTLNIGNTFPSQTESISSTRKR